jgi:Family of unknown function (DUF6221)
VTWDDGAVVSDEKQYAFVRARLDDEEAAARAQLERMPEDFAGDVTPVQAFALGALRDVETKRAIVQMNEQPQHLDQEPAYYAGLWEPFLAIASSYDYHPDYGRLFG